MILKMDTFVLGRSLVTWNISSIFVFKSLLCNKWPLTSHRLWCISLNTCCLKNISLTTWELSLLTWLCLEVIFTWSCQNFQLISANYSRRPEIPTQVNTCPTVHPSVPPSVHLSVRLSVHLSVCVFKRWRKKARPWKWISQNYWRFSRWRMPL